MLPIPRTVAADAAPAPFDAAAQQAFLAAAMRTPVQSPAEPPAPPEAPRPHRLANALAALQKRRSTAAKSAIAFVAALLLVWTPLQRLMSTTSAQAIVNARIVTLRAPIDGIVSAAGTIETGTRIAAGADVLQIENTRADPGTLIALRQSRAQIETTIAVLEARRRVLAERIASLGAQIDAFRQGRIGQLEKRASAIDADLVAARAAHAATADALVRTRALSATGIVSQARLDASASETTAALQLIERLSRQKEGVLVELDAMRAGVFIGDSFNDMPQSAQRRQDDELLLAEIDARLSSARTEAADVEAQTRAETTRHAALARAPVRSAVAGHVWEMLVAPGETVSRGQDLVKVVDCASATVTAAVNETVYQRLVIGQRAEFRPRTGGPAMTGTITGLSGLSAIGTASAIHQSALSKEPYKVTLKFPDLDRAGHCLLGRSGLVVFDVGEPTAAPATLRTTFDG
jgi:multidrug resistance efflux pump